jgi:hypothetical protein
MCCCHIKNFLITPFKATIFEKGTKAMPTYSGHANLLRQCQLTAWPISLSTNGGGPLMTPPAVPAPSGNRRRKHLAISWPGACQPCNVRPDHQSSDRIYQWFWHCSRGSSSKRPRLESLVVRTDRAPATPARPQSWSAGILPEPGKPGRGGLWGSRGGPKNSWQG